MGGICSVKWKNTSGFMKEGCTKHSGGGGRTLDGQNTPVS